MKNKKDFNEKIIIRAIKDEEFKKELKSNPKKVIERELGEKISEDLKITIIEETPNTFHIVIPKIPDVEKFSDEELKEVVGGVKGSMTCAITC